MTSPNRETEAQQVEARVEQIVLTKAKASLMGKTGAIRVNLEVPRTITDREQQKMGMLKISKADRQEREKEAALNPERATAAISDQEQEEMGMPKISKADHQEMEKEAALNRERATAAISDQEQEEMGTPKILKADHQEMEKEAATNQEKATAAISDQEKAGTAKAILSDRKAQEAPEDLRTSNPAHSKKAVLKKCQETKAAVM
jgi:urease gamma subunit